MKNKKIVWALFDDGEQSVFNSLSKEKYTVYSFGIIKKETVNYLDIAKTNVIEKLKNFPKPDIIVASPMCQSFSRAAAMKFKETKGNASWYEENGILNIRPKNHYENKRYNFERQKTNALIGSKAIQNTIKIIEFYKPKFWYIENPKTSLMWSYIYEFELKGRYYE